MQHSDSFWRLTRAGSTGIMALALAGAAAEAALPTGGMLLPRPRGPARADLPAHTAIDYFRIPSATAYGISAGPALSATEKAFAVDAPAATAERTGADSFGTADATPVPDATPVADRPLIQPRMTSAGDAADPFSLPEPEARSGNVQADPFADLSGEPEPFEDSDGSVKAIADAPIPADAWETDDASASAEAAYAGLKGICPVTLREERRVVEPKSELFVFFEGRRYEFATADAKAAFEIDPQKYAPVLGGRDVVLTAAGAEEAVGTLQHAGVYRERLYLFQTAETCKRFYDNPRRFLVNE